MIGKITRSRQLEIAASAGWNLWTGERPCFAGGDLPRSATSRGPRLPLSRLQSAFWIEEALSGEGQSLAFGIDFDRQIDLRRLDRALVAVVAKHPLLRAKVESGAGGLTMSIERPPVTILGQLEHRSGLLEGWLAQPLGMRSWPLFRTAAAVNHRGTRFRFVTHHSVFDGESKDVFLRDLTHAYRERLVIPPESIPSSAPFWSDVVDREALDDGPRAEGSRRPERALARLAPRRSNWESRRFRFDAAQQADVRTSARCLGVSTFTVYLAAWQAALARLLSDEIDVVSPIAVSTRTPASAGQVGPFFNQVAIRSEVPGRRTFRSLATNLGGSVRRLARLRHAPGTFRSEGGAVGRPEIELALSYRRSSLGRLNWPDANAAAVLLPTRPAAKHSNVVVRMVAGEQSTLGVIDLNSGSFPAGFIDRLESCWRMFLRDARERRDTVIAELPLEQPTAATHLPAPVDPGT